MAPEELGASENWNRVVSKLHQLKFEDGQLPAKSKFLHDTLPIEFQHALTLTKTNFNELKINSGERKADGINLRSMYCVNILPSKVTTCSDLQCSDDPHTVHNSLRDRCEQIDDSYRFSSPLTIISRDKGQRSTSPTVKSWRRTLQSTS